MNTSIVLTVAHEQYNKRLYSTNLKRLQNYLCVTRSLSTRFLLVLTFREELLTFFQEETSKRDERKDHGTLDESSSEQQVCESADYTLIVKKNWSPRPSATGSYRREGVRQNMG